MYAHVIPLRTNFLIFGLLILLTLATVGADYIDLGMWNLVVAITIAVVKAVLVALYFMHLRYSSHLSWIFVLAALAWLFILIGISVGDVVSRTWVFVPQGWE